MRLRIYLLSGCFFFFGSGGLANAQGTAQPRMLVFGIGSYHTAILRAAASKTGSKSIFGTIDPSITLSFRLGRIAPSLAYTPLGRKGVDDSYVSRTLLLSLPILLSRGASELRLGPSYSIHMLSGQGGSVLLNNGTSTATFAKPAGTSVTGAFFLNFGVSLPLGKRMALGFDALAGGILSSRRSFNALIQLNYGVL